MLDSVGVLVVARGGVVIMVGVAVFGVVVGDVGG